MNIKEKIVRAKNDFDEVYEAGKKSEYDRFWDVYQENGKKTDYMNAFSGRSWNSESLRPKYDIKPIAVSHMFKHNRMTVNITDYLAEQGIALDFSKVTSFSEMLLYADITGLGTVDTRAAATLNNAFARSTGLETIRLLILKEDGSQTFNSYTFIECLKLKNITIQGVIGRDFDIKQSPLTVESMKSVINALKNYSGTDKKLAYTVSFSSACWERLEAESSAPNGDTWKNYVNSLGWKI